MEKEDGAGDATDPRRRRGAERKGENEREGRMEGGREWLFREVRRAGVGDN